MKTMCTMRTMRTMSPLSPMNTISMMNIISMNRIAKDTLHSLDEIESTVHQKLCRAWLRPGSTSKHGLT